ncbi:hypothetical protein Hte_005731 [Hypoxylon texense]
MSGLWDVDSILETSPGVLIKTNPKSIDYVTVCGPPDVLLHCQDQSWFVHLSVVCSRSPRLNDIFVDGSGIVTEARVCGNAEFTRHGINHIYAGGLDPALFANEDEAYVNCAKLWEVACNLSVNTMMVEILKQLAKLLRAKVVRCQRLRCDYVDLPREELVGLKAGVQLAYEKNFEPLKKFYVHFVEDTHFWVIEEDAFKEILTAVPEYRKDVFAKIPTLDREGDFRPRAVPLNCVDCGIAALDEGNHWAMLADGDGGAVATCYKCWQQLDPDSDSSDDDYE